MTTLAAIARLYVHGRTGADRGPAQTGGGVDEHQRSSMSEETVVHSSGAKTSVVPRLDLIPYEALLRLAERFEKGMARYGRNNWRKGLADKDYVLERAAHLLNHAARFIAKLEGHIPDDGDDDVGAILWAGAFLAVRTTCKCGVTMRPIQTTCDDCEDAVKRVAEAVA